MAGAHDALACAVTHPHRTLCSSDLRKRAPGGFWEACCGQGQAPPMRLKIDTCKKGSPATTHQGHAHAAAARARCNRIVVLAQTSLCCGAGAPTKDAIPRQGAPSALLQPPLPNTGGAGAGGGAQQHSQQVQCSWTKGQSPSRTPQQARCCLPLAGCMCASRRPLSTPCDVSGQPVQPEPSHYYLRNRALGARPNPLARVRLCARPSPALHLGRGPDS